jgi:hypothetical protein
MNPRKAERRPSPRSAARTAESSPSATIAQSRSRRRPPLAPASVYAPRGRRRHWWYCYPCRVCNTFHFGRASELDKVTGERRAGCGHAVSVMIARVYGTTP